MLDYRSVVEVASNCPVDCSEIRRKHQLSLVVKLSIIYGPDFSTIQRVGVLAGFLEPSIVILPPKTNWRSKFASWKVMKKKTFSPFLLKCSLFNRHFHVFGGVNVHFWGAKNVFEWPSYRWALKSKKKWEILFFRRTCFSENFGEA